MSEKNIIFSLILPYISMLMFLAITRYNQKVKYSIPVLKKVLLPILLLTFILEKNGITNTTNFILPVILAVLIYAFVYKRNYSKDDYYNKIMIVNLRSIAVIVTLYLIFNVQNSNAGINIFIITLLLIITTCSLTKFIPIKHIKDKKNK